MRKNKLHETTHNEDKGLFSEMQAIISAKT